jgi:hypothetical protein
MKLTGFSILLFMWMAFAEAHPLHLSITNITYENGLLKINLKTFLDDWAVAYFHYHGTEIDFGNGDARQNPWFSKYLEACFSIAPDKGGTHAGLTIDTILVKDETMTIEMRGALEGNPKTLYIYNALLTDIFPDQSNLVIFEYGERETGIKFDVRKHEEVVELN